MEEEKYALHMQNDQVNLDDLRPDIEESHDMIDVDLQGDHKAQKLMVTELTRSMSAKSIARSIFPKVSVLKKSLKMQYMLLLLEKILDEVNKLIFYISIIEILAWGLGFLCFLAYPSGMALIWFHLIHVPRGAFGLFIVMKKSPKAYEIIEEISEFDSNEMKENWNFEQMVAFFLIYFILSAVNTIIDLIGLIIQVVLFGTSSNVYEPLFMIGVICVFTYSNSNYLFYLVSFVYRLPPQYRKDVVKAVVGKTETLVERITLAYQKKLTGLEKRDSSNVFEPSKRPHDMTRQKALNS